MTPPGPIESSLASSISISCLFRSKGRYVPPLIKLSRISATGGIVCLIILKGRSLAIASSFLGRVEVVGQGAVQSVSMFPLWMSYETGRAKVHHESFTDGANVTFTLLGLRKSDAGRYVCEVKNALAQGQDFVDLKVHGVVYHYRPDSGRYTLSHFAAQAACVASGGTLASPAQLLVAFHDGMDRCDAGWLSDGSVRYPINRPRAGCEGDCKGVPGVRTYGLRQPREKYDAYCYAEKLQGEVIYTTAPGQLTLAAAWRLCWAIGAHGLATPAALHLAWQAGLDHCEAGWLADGSVRYPICTHQQKCGSLAKGIYTLYRYANQSGFPDPGGHYGAYCHIHTLSFLVKMRKFDRITEFAGVRECVREKSCGE
uniref:Link domain-containing protein n=1 Tax=Eptatretus burgeri TaxID=7764 RepID=A0A8C4R9Q4_EPTBU